jgi:large-conductance mechanosensitive channel
MHILVGLVGGLLLVIALAVFLMIKRVKRKQEDSELWAR